jgi:hypothetical protein
MNKKTIQEEVNRFKSIERYGKKMILEQEIPTPEEPTPAPANNAEAPPADTSLGTEMGGTDTTIPPTDGAMPTDAPLDPTMTDTEDTEEIDITDLVNMTRSIKKDVDDSKHDNNNAIAKMDNVFSKLDSLSQQLEKMDMVIAKIEQLGSQVEKMKPETPEEKLEMRSLDSYPFNQKPNEFFTKKQEEMRASGKNEYVLTKDDVNDYTANTLRDTFNPDQEEENEYSY